jgi:hypothetical protein
MAGEKKVGVRAALLPNGEPGVLMILPQGAIEKLRDGSWAGQMLTPAEAVDLAKLLIWESMAAEAARKD